eukprot:2890797-Rhodomonas_salina.1
MSGTELAGTFYATLRRSSPWPSRSIPLRSDTLCPLCPYVYDPTPHYAMSAMSLHAMVLPGFTTASVLAAAMILPGATSDSVLTAATVLSNAQLVLTAAMLLPGASSESR